MFECTLENGELFKKIVAALSDLVEQGNFMLDANMISFQGMDTSHVSLVALQLKECGFEPYRCDRDVVLGIQFSSLNKILKCMTSKDALSIRADDEGDIANFIFESKDNKRISNFELKLNDIDAEQLGIPQTEYAATIKMPSSEFQRICRDLSAIGDTVTIGATKQGIRFSVSGDIGSGDMTLRGNISKKKKVKKVKKEENKNNNNNDDDEDDDMAAIKVKEEVQETPGNDEETQMDNDDDGDEKMGEDKDDQDDKKDNGETPGGDNDDDDEEENNNNNTGNVDDEDDDDKVMISLDESVTQTFSLRYLNNFTKATGLSKHVHLRMGPEVPLEVEYQIEQWGSLRYYLAPKIDEE